MSAVSIGQVERICFIGGGKLMADSALYARESGFEVVVVVAERHAHEQVANGQTLLDVLARRSIRYKVLLEPSAASVYAAFSDSRNALGLCFGPAWIFPPEVVGSFSRGMFNVNAIPGPRYLGGAHYTWQILNRSREIGCFIQKVENEVDRGDVYMREISELESSVEFPESLFELNYINALDMVKKFLNRVRERAAFAVTPFELLNHDRIYFPRLLTEVNGWIDWSWSGKDIGAFCNGFSDPYQGASTYYRNRQVKLRKVYLHLDEQNDFHPFCYGLVVRVLEHSFFVSVSGGLLEVLAWSFVGEEQRIAEGERLFTDELTLQKAKNTLISSRFLNGTD